MTTLTSFDSTVNSFYLAFYGRPADPAGLQFWSQQLASVNGDMHAISAAFSTSEEATARFGSHSVADRITDIYQQLFNRAPDDAGLSYWLDMVENGHASLAGVALDILKGAQGNDHVLADLRQQAMDSFTAQVETAGSGYAGYASVEAARVLVRAVTLDSSGADIDKLVKAAVSFADTATKNPAVVDAIATGSTLLAMYDTVRGLGDPVALTQALADTAKAAAGNPATLDSLLRGGGMAQVLKVMPDAATLQDVVDALATGGLPAAVEVVYPSAPDTPVVVVPTFNVQFAFSGVTQGAGDTHVDNVTNVPNADVKFSYTGSGLKAGQHVEYSLDGGVTWSKDGITVSTDDHSVTIAGVDLETGSTAASSAPLAHIMTPVENLPNLITTVSVRAADASGATSAPVSQQIVYDHFAATPRVVLDNDTAGADFGNGHDLITRDGNFKVTGIEAGATVEYQVDIVVTASHGPGTDSAGLPPLPPPMVIPGTAWTTDAPTLHEGLNSFTVRQRDAAGNVSGVDHVEITVDTRAPAAPTIALVTDSGIAGDGITAVGKVAITGLDTDVKTAWEYSSDGGDTWTFGHANDGSGQAELDLTDKGDGLKAVLVRQYDAAGNESIVSNQIGFTLDAAAPAPALSFAFMSVTQGSADTLDDNVTNVANPLIQFGYTGDLGDYHFEFSTDGVSWSDEGVVAADHIVTVHNVNLAAGTAVNGGGLGPMLPPGAFDPSLLFLSNPSFVQPPANLETTVQLRLVDGDGNTVGDPVSQKIVLDSYVQPLTIGPNSYMQVHGYGQLTTDGAYVVYGKESGATLEYLVDTVTSPLVVTANAQDPQNPVVQQPTIVAGTTWTKDKPVLAEGYNSIHVRQTDAAGNVSEAAHMTVVYDSQKPVAPAVALAEDTGVPGDNLTRTGKILVTGLETGFLTHWEYRFEGDQNWYRGGDNDGSGQAVYDMSTMLTGGPVGLQVRQVDAANNASAASELFNFTLDNTAPEGDFTFKYVEQPNIADNTVTDLASASVYFQYNGNPAADDLFQYRVDGGSWVTLGADAYDSQTHLLATGKVDLSLADHKVEVRAIDMAGNEGLSAGMQIDSTANNPVAEKSTMIYVNPTMYTSAPILFFTTTPHTITKATGDGSANGLADQASLTLNNMNFGTEDLPPDNYFDGPGFSINSSSMTLDAMPALGFYKLNWTDATFRTTGPSGHGYVAAGSALFVAGGAGTTTVQGFMIGNIAMITADVNESSLHASNVAYIGTPNVDARIQTGGGMDVVSDNNGNLTIVYDTFDSSAQDVILGFDAGGDVIEINGSAAVAIDNNGNGQIEWASQLGPKLVVGSNIEGVRINTAGILTTSPVSYEAAKTVATLNAALDVRGLHVGDDLLLLAGTSDHNALIWYEEKNDDGLINAAELTFVAVAGNGAISPLDIQLIGSAAIPGG